MKYKTARAGFVLAGITACGGAGATETLPPSVPSSGSTTLHIEPAVDQLPVEGVIQLHAVNASGVSLPVRWTITPSSVGSISDAGLLTTTVCANRAATRVQATLLADTSQTAALFLAADHFEPASLTFDLIQTVTGSVSVDPDSLRGVVGMGAELNQALRCSPLRVIRLENVGEGFATPLDSLLFPDAHPPDQHPVILWDTRRLTNGTYLLRLQAGIDESSRTVVSTTLPVRIDNP